MTALSPGARLAVLLAAIAGLLFDGVELGLMPVASISVSQDLLDGSYTATLGGHWFARFTAALMLGAAIGGILLLSQIARVADHPRLVALDFRPRGGARLARSRGDLVGPGHVGSITRRAVIL